MVRDLLCILFFYILPGSLPAAACIRQRPNKKALLFCMGTFCFDLLISCLVYAAVRLVVGEPVILIGPQKDSFYSCYVLMYVSYAAASYGMALLLAAVITVRRKVTVSTGFYSYLAVGIGTFLFVGIIYDTYAREAVVINEVCGSNLSIILDGNGDNSDYIELYNPTMTAVSLDGWFLSDSGQIDEKYQLKDIELPPHSYIVLFANGNRGMQTNSDWRSLSFKIKEGEEIGLFDSSGKCIDRVKLPKTGTDISYVRRQDGKAEWITAKYGTPGTSNDGMEAYIVPTLEKPVFSVESGFYDDEITLEITSEKGNAIYYTTDGSIPDQGSNLYTGEITVSDRSGEENLYAGISELSLVWVYAPLEPVDKATVVKAICVSEKGEVSDVATAVYFIGYEGRPGYEGVKILSLTCDPEDLFSQDRGIYVLGEQAMGNYMNRSKTGERKALAMFFDEEHNLMSAQNIGIRIHGGYSRHLNQKAFSFYARAQYGSKDDVMNKVMLRNGGVKDTYATMLRDIFNQSLVKDRNVITQDGEPCILFLNGEYWGLYIVQEKYSKEYFEQECQIDENNLVKIKENGSQTDNGEETILYSELLDFASEHDLSKDEEYRRIQEMMDVQNYIDYNCFELYVGNADWPSTNIGYYRSRTVGGIGQEDGRWRWVIYDVDDTVGMTEKSQYYSNSFMPEGHYEGRESPMETTLMSNLLENEAFKKQFTLTFLDMANENFAYETVHDKLYETANVFAEPMVESVHRFSPDEYTIETFWDNIAVIDEFYEKRGGFILPCLAEALELGGREGEVRLEAVVRTENGVEPVDGNGTAGVVSLNSLTPDMEGGSWSGIYFTDYPVRASATAAAGYRFLGWEGTYESAEAEIEADVSEQGICLRAVFEKRDEK